MPSHFACNILHRTRRVDAGSQPFDARKMAGNAAIDAIVENMKMRPMRGKIPWSLLRVAAGFIIAAAALHRYDAEPFDPNQVVLGKELSQKEEQWNGQEFTSWSVPDAKAMVA